MPSEKSHDANDESHAAQNPVVDFTFDDMQMPEIQAFGQDEGGPGVQCSRRKSSAWNDVGIDSREQEPDSEDDTEDKSAPLRPPAKATANKRMRKPQKQQKAAPRKRPRKAHPDSDAGKAPGNGNAIEKNAKRNASSSPEPELTPRAAARRFLIYSSVEPDEKSSFEPQSASAPPPLAKRKSISWAELGPDGIDEDFVVPLKARARVTKRERTHRRPSSASDNDGDEAGVVQAPIVRMQLNTDGIHKDVIVPLKARARVTKREPTHRKSSSASDNDEDEAGLVQAPIVRRQPRRLARARPWNRNEARPAARALKLRRSAAVAVLSSTKSSDEEKVSSDEPLARRERQPNNTITSMGQHIDKERHSRAESGGEGGCAAALGRKDPVKSQGERQVFTAKNKIGGSIPGEEGVRSIGARRNSNLYQTSSKSSDSDREIAGNQIVFPTNHIGRTTGLNMKMKQNATEKEVDDSSESSCDDEFRCTRQKRRKEQKSPNKPSKQSSKADAVGTVAVPAPQPDESDRVGQCGKRPGQRRGTSDEVNPSVMKEIEGATCLVCNELSEGEKMVLCDACCSGCHIFCMRPKRRSVPLGVWLCPGCHEAAKRHRIHVSEMVKLRWYLQCLECTTRNDPDIKLDCDKACADCRIAFHSACLRLYRKVTAAQLKDPGWKCSACVGLTDIGPSIRDGVPKATGTEPNAMKRLSVERLLPQDCGAKSFADPIPFYSSKASVKSDPTEVRGVTELENRTAPAKRESAFRRFERPFANRRPGTEVRSQATRTEPKTGFTKFVRPRGSGRNVSNGDVRTQSSTESPKGSIFEEDVVLDGSGFSGTPAPQPLESSRDGTEASSRLNTRGVTSLFRSPAAEKNGVTKTNGVSRLFKQRRSRTSPALMDLNHRDKEGFGSGEGTRGNVFDGYGGSNRQNQSFGNTKGNCVARDETVLSVFGRGHVSPQNRRADEERTRRLYDPLDSPSVRDEEVLDGGYAR